MPIRTFSPITESTDTSTSSPIMMLWLDLRVRTSIGCTLLVSHGHKGEIAPAPPYAKHSVPVPPNASTPLQMCDWSPPPLACTSPCRLA